MSVSCIVQLKIFQAIEEAYKDATVYALPKIQQWLHGRGVCKPPGGLQLHAATQTQLHTLLSQQFLTARRGDTVLYSSGIWPRVKFKNTWK